MTINPATIGAICHRTGLPVDSDFASVVALGHMDDVGGSPVNPVNSCARGSPFILHGNANITGTSPQFGSGCLNLTGTSGCFLSSGSSADYAVGGTYTYEFSMKTASPSQTAFVYVMDGTSNASIIITGGAFQPRENNSNVGGGGTVATSTWQRVAVTVTGVVGRLFVDGILTGLPWVASVSPNSTNFRIGTNFTNSFLFTGQIDEFRLTKGICRYTANYTPAAVAFPDS